MQGSYWLRKKVISMMTSKDCQQCPYPKKLTCAQCGVQLCIAPPGADLNIAGQDVSIKCANVGYYIFDEKPYCVYCFLKLRGKKGGYP